METQVVVIDINSDGWFYYYYDKYNYRTKTEGFETHIKAIQHCKEFFGDKVELEILYK